MLGTGPLQRCRVQTEPVQEGPDGHTAGQCGWKLKPTEPEQPGIKPQPSYFQRRDLEPTEGHGKCAHTLTHTPTCPCEYTHVHTQTTVWKLKGKQPELTARVP